MNCKHLFEALDTRQSAPVQECLTEAQNLKAADRQKATKSIADASKEAPTEE